MDFADWVMTVRGPRSQRAICKAGDLSSAVVSRIERRVTLLPSFSILDGLAKGLGVPQEAVYVAAGIFPPDVRKFVVERPDGLEVIRAAMREVA